MVADVHPTDEADAARAELVAGLKRELESLLGGVEELERAPGDCGAPSLAGFRGCCLSQSVLGQSACLSH